MTWLARILATLTPVRSSDRGDVPGWVMVTMMTAILVVAILGVFRSAIVTAVQQAISNVQAAN